MPGRSLPWRMARASVCAPKPSRSARAGGDGDGGGGLADGVAQQRGGVPGRGRLVVLAGCVEADDGVEVDDAACLVFGDLDVADAQHRAQFLLRDPSEAGELAGQVGGEPAPQVARVGVEQHGGLVVVAVEAQRLAEPGIVLHMPGGAGDVVAVRAAAGMRVAAGAARQHGLAAHAAGVDRAERGGGEGGEHARVGGDASRGCLCRRSGPRGRAAGRRACRRPSRPGRPIRGGCRTRRAALPRARRRCRRPGRSRPWPGRWRRCGQSAGWGGCSCRSWRAGVPSCLKSAQVMISVCRRRSPPPRAGEGSGLRAAVAAVVVMPGCPSVAGRPGG